MFKKFVLAAASTAALAGVCAIAHAQLVPLELEGPLDTYTAINGQSGEMIVMGVPVLVDTTTSFVTPTKARTDLPNPNSPTGTTGTLPINQWIRGAPFEGLRRAGFLGNTVIVTGDWDPTAVRPDGSLGAVRATEVFSDISENVILGVITGNNCSSPTCQAPGDYIRANNGPAFVPNTDKRLPANAILDAGLFQLDLENADLTGTLMGGEGYYTIDPIAIGDGTTEKALVYWSFELGDIRPDLLLDKANEEVSVLRIRCDAGDRLEVRGWVHQPVDDFGQSTAGTAAVGTIRATMSFPNAPDIVRTSNDLVPELNNAYAGYQLRADVPNCADQVKVEWVVNGIVLAEETAPVDRLR